MKRLTQSLGIFRFNHEGRDIYLIDTPGFDDPGECLHDYERELVRRDEETLAILGHLLGVSYANRRYITGIVYLHSISDTGIPGRDKRNIDMLKSLCGQDAYRNIVVASTMWNSEDFQIMLQRENELLSNNNSWLGSVCDPDRATYFRHAGMGSGSEEERQSALRIVSHLFQQGNLGPVPLQIQHELVDAGKSLQETQAGQAMLGDIERIRQRLQKRLDELKSQPRRYLKQNDIELMVDTLLFQLQINSAASKRAHGMFVMTLLELHEQEKSRLLHQMDSIETGCYMTMDVLQKNLKRSRAELKKTRAEALKDPESKEHEKTDELQNQERLNELQKQIVEDEKRLLEVSASTHQRKEAHKNVRRVLADGIMSSTASGVVGGK
jgi:hypothetical protein